MPSPIAHSLIGLSLGVAWLSPVRASLKEALADFWRLRWPLAICVLAANAPDCDFLPGLVIGQLNAFHQTYTHTLLFSAVAGFLLAQLCRAWPARRAVLWLFLLGLSHLAADAVTVDTREPIGVMAFWPITASSFTAPFHIFMPIQKATWRDIAQPENWRAASVELAWCLPLLLAVLTLKVRASKSAHLASTPRGNR